MENFRFKNPLAEKKLDYEKEKYKIDFGVRVAEEDRTA